MKTTRAIFLSLICVSACAEIMEENYPTLLMAEEQGAIQRGWVPDWLPTNAFNIREAHDLDTNQFMLRFAARVGWAEQSEAQHPLLIP